MSKRLGGAEGRPGALGTIFTDGSPITRAISAKNLVMSSSGSARISSIASACEGITFSRNPAFSIVGEMDVRKIEYLPRSFSAK